MSTPQFAEQQHVPKLSAINENRLLLGKSSKRSSEGAQ
jgi:hypothetical protein